MPDEQFPAPKEDTSLDPKVIALITYLLWLPGGIVFLATSKDQYVRFHAAQSILFSLFLVIIYICFMIFGFTLWFLAGFVALIIWTAVFATWILLMIKAYQGIRFKLPIIGKIAEKYAK